MNERTCTKKVRGMFLRARILSVFDAIRCVTRGRLNPGETTKTTEMRSGFKTRSRAKLGEWGFERCFYFYFSPFSARVGHKLSNGDPDAMMTAIRSAGPRTNIDS